MSELTVKTNGMRHIEHETDLCIIGGGLTGLCAAIAAAREGTKVVLIQDRPVLGGNASSEIRMWVRGAHGLENRETGIISEIEEENIYLNPTLIPSPFDNVLWAKVKAEKNIRKILFENPKEILEAAKEMKIKENFTLRHIADEYIVMPTGSSIANFDGAIALNEVSAFIFEKLTNPMSKDDLVIALLNEYNVDKETATKDIDALISKFEEMGIIE